MNQPTIHRRAFLAATSGAAVGAAIGGLSAWGQAAGGKKIAWKRDAAGKLFVQCSVDSRPIVPGKSGSLLDAFCGLGREESGRRLALGAKTPSGTLGPIRAELTHRLLDSGSGKGEDLLEATLRLTNTSDQAQEVCCGFVSNAQPRGNPAEQRAYLPLAASGMLAHGELKSLGYDQVKGPRSAGERPGLSGTLSRTAGQRSGRPPEPCHAARAGRRRIWPRCALANRIVYAQRDRPAVRPLGRRSGAARLDGAAINDARSGSIGHGTLLFAGSSRRGRRGLAGLQSLRLRRSASANRLASRRPGALLRLPLGEGPRRPSRRTATTPTRRCSAGSASVWPRSTAIIRGGASTSTRS